MDSAWVISIGSELVLGQVADTNSAWIARQLSALGFPPDRHLVLPDELPAIRDALREAAGRCQVAVVSGGLGPTDDDLTREALAAAAGAPLQPDAASLERIRTWFERRGRPMPERNRVQAMIPAGARAIPNDCGTAPGIHLVHGGTEFWCLPGVPYEMQHMFAEYVSAALAARAAGRVLRCRELHCAGMGESQINDHLADLMARGRNPQVGTTAEAGVISIHIRALAEGRGAAEALLDSTEAEIRRRLGRVVFGRDGQTLAQVVGEELVRRGETLSTAESCTGGLLGKLITDVPGSSAHYCGGVVAYSNRLKRELLDVPQDVLDRAGAVSSQTAELMARGACRRFGTTWALSITGIAGPGGGTPDKPVGLVYLGLAGPEAATVRQERFGEDSPRGVIRERAARAALNLLRLTLAGR